MKEQRYIYRDSVSGTSDYKQLAHEYSKQTNIEIYDNERDAEQCSARKALSQCEESSKPCEESSKPMRGKF